MSKISYFWFRRDLRLEDNTGLNAALNTGADVQPIFIFDTAIIDRLPKDDARISFIHQQLEEIQKTLNKHGASLLVRHGNPIEVWKELLEKGEVASIHCNRDYEPYALKRDEQVQQLTRQHGAEFCTYKDQVILEPGSVLKDDQTPYTVFTPFKKRWLSHFNATLLETTTANWEGLQKSSYTMLSLEELGFKESRIKVVPFQLSQLDDYDTSRDYPAMDSTSYLSPHLRFGTVSIRQIFGRIPEENETFISELIWREFFMHILWHFPDAVHHNFKRQYDGVQWRNNEEEFKRWCAGETGYPMVDAGMRQLNETGYMHNRIRMVTASFLCKHLLIDWRWGEAYFAEKLLDFELASNNGNWQWAAGTGCDASPYFRVFNPTSQVQKFDKELKYIRTWVKDLDELTYPMPMVDHKMARERAIETYKIGLGKL